MKIAEVPSFPEESDVVPFIDHFDLGITGLPADGRIHVRCKHCDSMHENALPRSREDGEAVVVVLEKFKCCTRRRTYYVFQYFGITGDSWPPQP